VLHTIFIKFLLRFFFLSYESNIIHSPFGNCILGTWNNNFWLKNKVSPQSTMSSDLSLPLSILRLINRIPTAVLTGYNPSSCCHSAFLLTLVAVGAALMTKQFWEPDVTRWRAQVKNAKMEESKANLKFIFGTHISRAESSISWWELCKQIAVERDH